MSNGENIVDASYSHLIQRFTVAPTKLSFSSSVTVDSGVLTPGWYRIIADAAILFLVDSDNSQTLEAITLVNELAADYELHRVETTDAVHGAADSTNVITETNPATDLTEAIALANDVKAQYEAHRVLTAGSVHAGADSTNTVSSADATDLASLTTLVNELKTDLNANFDNTTSHHGAASDYDITSGSVAVLDDTEGHYLPADQPDIIAISGDEDVVSVYPYDGSSSGVAHISRLGKEG